MNTKHYALTLIIFALIDAVWLTSTGAQYQEWLGPLFDFSINFVPAVIFYLLYAFGIMFFAVGPALKQNLSLQKTFMTGALLGLVAYGTYDLTNHAIIGGWPVIVTVLDMAWGAVLTGLTSVAVVKVARKKDRAALTS